MDELQSLFWFTEYDDKITGTSQRDPLGLQPIWSYYGRKIVKHLTTVSTDIRGFREVLLCLAVCAEYKQRHSVNSSYTDRDLILMFEQLFIYSAIACGKSEGIIGSDNGSKKIDPTVSPRHTILVNQISLGYYGRYKTPLNTMGVIDSQSRIAASVDVQTLFSAALYHTVYREFDEFMALKGDGKPFSKFQGQDDYVRAICGKFRAGEKEFWLEHFQIDGQNPHKIMRECFQKVSADQSASEVLKDQDFAGEDSVQDILRLEPFLRCVEDAFYKMLNADTLAGVTIEKLVEHKKRYDEFLRIHMPEDGVSGVLIARLEALKGLNPYADNYLRNICNYHNMVCDQKHSARWFEVDAGGRLHAYMQGPGSVDIEQWERSYYLSSLRSIKEGMEQC